MDKPAKRRPQLYIVNLQWTPKDCHAAIKINGKCDNVMKKLMKYLSVDVPEYSRDLDPIFIHATELCKEEKHTTNRPFLSYVKTEDIKEENKEDEKNSELKDFKLEIESQDIKTEIVTDTGQTNSVKEELILITIKSGENLEDCCSSFKNIQSHDKSCTHFDKNEIPIIMEDDVKNDEKDLQIVQNHDIKLEETEKAIVLAGKREELNHSNSFSMSNILSVKNNSNPPWSQSINLLSPHTLILNQLYNLFPIQNTAQLFNNFPGTIFMNNLFNPNFHLQNLGLVMPLLQNFSIENHQNAISIPTSFKRSNAITTVDLPRKKPKVEVVSDNSEPIPGNSEGSEGRRTRIRTNRNTKVLESTKCSPRKLANSLVLPGKCSFCYKQYSSNTCLFYVKKEPVFKPNVPTCECCDDEDEEEDVSDEKGGDDKASSDEKVNEVQKPVNPGWYGKGYKKHMKKKR